MPEQPDFEVKDGFLTWSNGSGRPATYPEAVLASQLAAQREENEALRRAIEHVVNDSPGTPSSVKGYLSGALAQAQPAREQQTERRKTFCRRCGVPTPAEGSET